MHKLKRDVTLSTEGQVYGVGASKYFGLKHQQEHCPLWTLCEIGDHKVIKIKTMTFLSLLLTSNHLLLVVGKDIHGQFGEPGRSIDHFEEIANNVKDFDAYDGYTLYLDHANQLYGRGANESAQLDLGRQSVRSVFSVKSATRSTSFFVNKNEPTDELQITYEIIGLQDSYPGESDSQFSDWESEPEEERVECDRSLSF